MTPKEKLLDFAKQNNFFRAGDAEARTEVSRVYLQRFVREGKLVRAAYGLYSLAGDDFTEVFIDSLSKKNCWNYKVTFKIEKIN